MMHPVTGAALVLIIGLMVVLFLPSCVCPPVSALLPQGRRNSPVARGTAHEPRDNCLTNPLCHVQDTHASGVDAPHIVVERSLNSNSADRIERRPNEGGRTRMFSQHQETLIVDMVRQNNAVRLPEIQQRIIEDNIDFKGINCVSLSTIDRVLQRNGIRIKQVWVPFEQNCERVKEQRCQYVQRIFELDSMVRSHEFIFVGEAGVNLTERRRRGRNVIIELPDQRGGNATICAAISSYGVLHSHVTVGPYNTELLVTFLDDLRDALLEQRDCEQAEHPMYVIIWDNMSFHHGRRIRDWFHNEQHFMNVFLPPYSPFLNPVEEFFTAWKWKVYDRNPYTQENLLQAMNEACGEIGVESCKSWIWGCLAREAIACDVDEVLWPDPAQRLDPEAE